MIDKKILWIMALFFIALPSVHAVIYANNTNAGTVGNFNDADSFTYGMGFKTFKNCTTTFNISIKMDTQAFSDANKTFKLQIRKSTGNTFPSNDTLVTTVWFNLSKIGPHWETHTTNSSTTLKSGVQYNVVWIRNGPTATTLGTYLYTNNVYGLGVMSTSTASTGPYSVFGSRDLGFQINGSATCTASDTTKPLVFSVIPVSNSNFNITNKILIKTNVTDETAVSTVRANVSRPGGVTTTITLKAGSAPKYNNTFTIPNRTGRYNVTFLANDTSNNKNWTVKTFFNVLDIFKPNVNNVRPTNATVFNVTNKVRISTNVTDSINVSQVKANLSRPGGLGLLQITLKKDGTTNTYNNSFTIPNTTGRYNITFDANDTSNNHNTSIKTTFNANDIIKPNVFDKYPRNGTKYNFTTKITISVNVTDNIAVGTVKANITRPGAVTTLTLKLSTTSRYNQSFTIPNVTGRYNVTFLANDTSGNKNWSIKTTFNVANGFGWNQTPQNKTIEWGTGLYYKVNASSVANAIIRYRINDTTRFTIGATNGRLQNNSAFTRLATYFVRITANNSQLFNVSSIIKIVVNDSTKPVVTALNISPRLVEYSYKINFSVNVSDLHSVKFVNMTINSSWYTKNFSTTKNGLRYNRSNTVNFKKLGKFTVRVYAKDNSSNENNTVFSTFRVNDTIKPSISITAIPSLHNRTRNITINYTTSDLFEVRNVKLFIFNYTNHTTKGLYNKTVLTTRTSPNGFFKSSIGQGFYKYHINATDNSSNLNQSITGNFTIDTIAPKNTSSFTTYGCSVTLTCNFFRVRLSDNFENYSSLTIQGAIQKVQVNNVNYTLSADTAISPYNYMASTQFATSGTYNTQYIYYRDAAGNTRRVPLTLNVTVTEQGITPSGGGGGGGGAILQPTQIVLPSNYLLSVLTVEGSFTNYEPINAKITIQNLGNMTGINSTLSYYISDENKREYGRKKEVIPNIPPSKYGTAECSKSTGTIVDQKCVVLLTRAIELPTELPYGKYRFVVELDSKLTADSYFDIVKKESLMKYWIAGGSVAAIIIILIIIHLLIKKP